MIIDNEFILNNCIPASRGLAGEKPFDYQYDGIKALFQKNRFLLSDDPGLGKTIQAIVAVNLIQKMRDTPLRRETPLKVLVIGTKSIIIGWQRKIAAWGTGNTEWTVINHDKLVGKDSSKYLRNWDIVIGDESQFYIKNVNTLRAKMFLQTILTAERVWLMTATPASKCASDYYVTLKVLLPAIFDKWSLSQFKKRYCERIAAPFTYSGYEYKGFHRKNILELNKVFQTCALGRKQEEVKKDLPPLTFSDYFVDADKVESFTKEEIAEIKSRILEGVDLGEHYQSILRRNAIAKIPSILELLNTYPADKKVVIFAWHRDVADKLVSEITLNTERKVDKITGEIVSATKRQEIIDRFQTGDLTTLVLNMQSGGVGIDLTAATVGIYVQFPSVASFWTQSLKRIHRIGSTEPVEIVKAMIAKSIDEEVFAVLQERLDYIEQVGLQSARN